MSDRPLGEPPSDPARSDDPTRDIRLPPLSVRPTGQVPSEWAGADGTRDEPAGSRAHEGPAVVLPTPAEPPVVPSPDATTVLDQRTDELPPPAEPPRQQTRPLDPPGDQARPGFAAVSPAGPVAQPPGTAEATTADRPVGSGGRPWTWALLVVLPILVIAGTGLLLFLLLGGG